MGVRLKLGRRSTGRREGPRRGGVHNTQGLGNLRIYIRQVSRFPPQNHVVLCSAPICIVKKWRDTAYIFFYISK